MDKDETVIWPPFEAFYIEEMQFNAISALKSDEDAKRNIQVLSSITPQEEQFYIIQGQTLNSLQNIVIQGAALSRYFWPSRNGPNDEHKRRADYLRRCCDVNDESPLKNRDLRNQIEHFDEKLDLYLSNGIVGNIYPAYFGVLPKMDGVPTHYFRAYFIDVGVFEMLGNRYKIQPLVDEIFRINKILTRFAENGYRLRVIED